MPTIPVAFSGATGAKLSARLEMPADHRPIAYALFAHCFTCAKDLKAVVNVSRALTQERVAVLRFDFTGLGQSRGDFAETTFSSNVMDLVHASRFLAQEYDAPQLLVGHSLGGAAVLRAASHLPAVRAIATIGAPCDPSHVLHLLSEAIDEIRESGEATVTLAGRSFRIRREFLDDLEAGRMDAAAASLGRALLILHSPVDETVGIENAQHLYEQARHPKSFVSLDGADHLLTRSADSIYAGRVIAAWARRYFDALPVPSAEALKDADRVVVRTGREHYATDAVVGTHTLLLDEPTAVGGQDLGPSPYDLISAGLGSCTSITLRMYADRKQWPLEEVRVRIRHERIHAKDQGEGGRMDRLEREIELVGDLDADQRQRLLAIAERCPVHRTLEAGVVTVTKLLDAP